MPFPFTFPRCSHTFQIILRLVQLPWLWRLPTPPPDRFRIKHQLHQIDLLVCWHASIQYPSFLQLYSMALTFRIFSLSYSCPFSHAFSSRMSPKKSSRAVAVQKHQVFAGTPLVSFRPRAGLISALSRGSVPLPAAPMLEHF